MLFGRVSAKPGLITLELDSEAANLGQFQSIKLNTPKTDGRKTTWPIIFEDAHANEWAEFIHVENGGKFGIIWKWDIINKIDKGFAVQLANCVLHLKVGDQVQRLQLRTPAGNNPLGERIATIPVYQNYRFAVSPKPSIKAPPRPTSLHLKVIAVDGTKAGTYKPKLPLLIPVGKKRPIKFDAFDAKNTKFDLQVDAQFVGFQKGQCDIRFALFEQIGNPPKSRLFKRLSRAGLSDIKSSRKPRTAR